VDAHPNRPPSELTLAGAQGYRTKQYDSHGGRDEPWIKLNKHLVKLRLARARDTHTGDLTIMAITDTVKLEINGSSQKIRMCAEHTGLPPLLIVQAGPGLPLLHEVRKF
jgi:hypothetical protein